jgi:hypothetical protein
MSTPTAPKISLKLKQKPEPKPEKTYYLAEGLMDSEFFKNYLEDRCGKGFLQRIRKYWKDLDDEEEGEGLEYKVFALENANDNVVEYTECWLLDYENGYIPIIVGGINTSSCYAGRRLHMDRDTADTSNWLPMEREFREVMEDYKTHYTLNEICEMLAPCVSKEGLRKAVTRLEKGETDKAVVYFNPSK